MTKQQKIKLGELLLQEKLVTPEQLDQVLAFQKSQQSYKPLGELCVEMKFISPFQLNRVLNRNKKRIRLGDLLINLNLISANQLETALKAQKQEKLQLGKILVKLGFITETALINALTIQLGVSKIIPDTHILDKKLLEGISDEFLVKNEVIPAFREEDTVTVIMSDPLNDGVLRTLENIYKCKIEAAIAPATDILNAIRSHFQKATLSLSGYQDEERKDLVIGDYSLSPEAGDSTVSILDYIITSAITEGASDIHIEPKEKTLRIRYRIDGILRHKTDLPTSLAPNLNSRIKAICGLDIAEKRRHQDGRIEARIGDSEVDLRISVYASVHGENIVIRILRRQSELIDLDSLGISPYNRKRFNEILDQPTGVIMVTGPTGSGKTTSLYAALNYLNNGERSIITVEDPVEYTIDGVVQGQLNPKIGHTYTDFLKSMMRQDPDVIMVGEIRDSVAAAAVIQAALTGHKVLTTFHTDDTTGALLRLMDMGIDTFLISSTVVSVIAQRLVRLLCPACRRPLVPDPGLLASFNVAESSADIFKFYQPEGCPMCSDSGFKGRTAIHELLCLNDAIRDAILTRQTSTQIRNVAREKADLISMREDGFYKSTLGHTSLEEILRVVFFNEGDALNRRRAADIVTQCEGRAAIPEHTETGRHLADVAVSKSAQLDLADTAETASPEGELSRIRIDITTIDGDMELIADFFHVYRDASSQVGRVFEEHLLDSFIDFITLTAKRMEVKHRAEFLEFSIQAKGDRIRLILETFVQQRSGGESFAKSRETGLRLINFLMPASGFQRALQADPQSRGLLPPSGTRPRLSLPADSGDGLRGESETPVRRAGSSGGTGEFKKYVEELQWEGTP